MSELLAELELRVTEIQREIRAIQKELNVISLYSSNNFHETTAISMSRKMGRIAFLEGQIAGLGYACSHIVKGELWN